MTCVVFKTRLPIPLRCENWSSTGVVRDTPLQSWPCRGEKQARIGPGRAGAGRAQASWPGMGHPRTDGGTGDGGLAGRGRRKNGIYAASATPPTDQKRTHPPEETVWQKRHIFHFWRCGNTRDSTTRGDGILPQNTHIEPSFHRLFYGIDADTVNI